MCLGFRHLRASGETPQKRPATPKLFPRNARSRSGGQGCDLAVLETCRFARGRGCAYASFRL